ncbi:hypothetical protein [Streptomyces sp. NPDC055709]
MPPGYHLAIRDLLAAVTDVGGLQNLTGMLYPDSEIHLNAQARARVAALCRVAPHVLEQALPAWTREEPSGKYGAGPIGRLMRGEEAVAAWGPACPACTAARTGRDVPARRYLAPEERVCTRHYPETVALARLLARRSLQQRIVTESGGHLPYRLGELPQLLTEIADKFGRPWLAHHPEDTVCAPSQHITTVNEPDQHVLKTDPPLTNTPNLTNQQLNTLSPTTRPLSPGRSTPRPETHHNQHQTDQPRPTHPPVIRKAAPGQ